MLRLSLKSTSSFRAARSIGVSTGRAQCRLPQPHHVTPPRRFYADVKVPFPGKDDPKPSIKDPKPPVLPGGEDKAAPEVPPAAKAESPLSPPKKEPTPLPSSSDKTTAEQVPLTPPPAEEQTATPPKVKDPPKKDEPAPAASSKPSPSSPDPTPELPKPRKKRRFRRFLFGLTFLTTAAFGGGVFYSLKSDNFHDFFTEYIPFGEEAVLYFEEREFRRRFPNALSRIKPKDEPPAKIHIPKSAGATWKLHGAGEKQPGKRAIDVSKPGPHVSGTKAAEEEKKADAPAAAPTTPESGTSGSGAQSVVVDVKPAPPSTSVKKIEAIEKPKEKGKTAPSFPAETAVALNSLDLPESSDPIVQDLANAVNGIITLINSSGTAQSYESAIQVAKSELTRLNEQLSNLKVDVEKQIREQLNAKDLEFTKAAQGLLTNVNNEIVDMEHKWKEEFDAEREKITADYKRKLHTELTRAHEIATRRLENELLEQAVEMKRKFIAEIKDRVENERNGRLGKLQELEEEVTELEKLATEWSSVVDETSRTQQIFTALEAVRASYSSDQQPRPFLREMAALKEVANDNDLVDAAIKSINPEAYQDGVTTTPQLVDRFRKVAEEVRKVDLLPEDAGIAAHAANWVLSKLMFRRTGYTPGDDVDAILNRAEFLLEEGDVDAAAREVNQLRGWARALAQDWLYEARKWLEVEQALKVIAAEARVQSLRVQR